MYIHKQYFPKLSMKPNHLNIFHDNGWKFWIILTADLKLNSIHYLIRLNLVLVSWHLCFLVTLKFKAVITGLELTKQNKNYYLVRWWWTQLLGGRRIPCAITTSQERYVISCRAFQAVPHFLSSSQTDKGTAQYLPPRRHIYLSGWQADKLQIRAWYAIAVSSRKLHCMKISTSNWFHQILPMWMTWPVLNVILRIPNNNA